MRIIVTNIMTSVSSEAMLSVIHYTSLWTIISVKINPCMILFIHVDVSVYFSSSVGKERGPYLSAMPRQADHRACLELLRNRPLTGAIHMEA